MTFVFLADTFCIPQTNFVFTTVSGWLCLVLEFEEIIKIKNEKLYINPIVGAADHNLHI